ncbi:Receptor-like serine/threonine-protein kinase SD1-7 [Dichanthelium oligosanthes]|uniref:Receptor-like serine/threonine-protein kinase SD1-7 n=1 Tax=Dichanthelium oligosanthes TaxID=888268 RepID=A0A1E5VWJ4_9POAL|nr:Receptor-like serine/threonine-protein kinase SD1-7 [Dichanthelium oligosanthes]
MRPSAWRLAIALLLLSSSLPPLATGDITYANVCGKTKYKPNSTYQYNVQQATAYLTNYPTFSIGTGFATVAYGSAPDVVHGLGLCRGDTPDNLTCYECLASAAVVASTLCPYDRDATLFYDGCIMRFSDQDFLLGMGNEPVVVLNATDTVKPTDVATSFDALVDHLMDKTAGHAAASDIPTKKMATGEAVFDEGDRQMKIYSLVQCTPDLTASGCSGCLKQVMDIMALRQLGALGERVAGVRCNVRFEVYPFYIGEAMVRILGLEAPSPAPLPSSPPPSLVISAVSTPSNTDTTRGVLLNWNRRRHIIEGIAQGLLYLHKHSRLRVIHRDLKASNILLDGNMSPKISDFGLARIFGSNETHANTSRVVGTHGYMAPEYASEGLFSIKSDVFSFGVLLLEIITGKRNIGFHQSGNFPNLIGYVWLLWKEEKWFEVIDPCLNVKHPDMEIMRFINVALMCVQDNAADRPTMTEVTSLLVNESVSLPDPKQPAYFNIRATNGGDQRPLELEDPDSINDVTSSPPNGR